ncbi:MAG: M20/M25/M40 family metallo-hydrolase [Planctomycetes bacterium]|nr:M20/M25/M40 family metallo-hydrolase [Planctomycetota bacterium]
MRNLLTGLIFWATACAALAISTSFTPPQAEAQAPSNLVIYAYGDDVDARDRLIELGAMYEDLGGYLLGERNTELAKRLAVAVEELQLADGQNPLVAVRLHHHDPTQPGNPAETGGQLLWRSADQHTAIRALPVELIKQATKAGFSCHGALRSLSFKQPLQPTYFQEKRNSATVQANIAAMVAQVSQQNLLDSVNTMVNFGTRRHYQPGEVNAQNWLQAELNALGLTTSLHNYDSGADVVIGELTGVTYPDKIVIVGGHYDSINNSTTSGPAPGADDDASGVAGVLEIARILSQYQFDYTIRFCGFSGEEYGLLGSEAYADHLDNINADVVAMVQLDMIAYRANGDSLSVGFVTNDTTTSLNNFAMDVFSSYVPALPVNSGQLSGGTSDHRSFFQHGFPACFPFEDIGQYSPYIHTSQDVVGVSANDFYLAELITKGSVATMAELARPVSLQLTHSALQDTKNDLGPYYAGVVVRDLGGNGVASVNLHWRADGGSWNTQVMSPTGNPDEYGAGIPGQPSPTAVDYYITATDGAGAERFLPEGFGAGSTWYSFLVGNTVRIYFNDFEGTTDEGWAHTYGGGTSNDHDDWQRGAPHGQAGDPGSAYSGSNIWGNDLGASGWNGEYQSNVNIRLASPDIDCTGKTGLRLRYRRQLSVEDATYDQARLRVAGNVIWENPIGSTHQDTAWTLHDMDISALADNNPALVVRFELRSDGGLEYGGWNIDDFEVYSVAASNNQDYLTLSGPNSVVAGNPVTYTLTGAPAGKPWWLLYSTKNSGTVISGHDFDLGSPYTVVGNGTTDALGAASFTANVPANASGLTVYVEGAAHDAGGSGSILDSNMMALSIL